MLLWSVTDSTQSPRLLLKASREAAVHASGGTEFYSQIAEDGVQICPGIWYLELLTPGASGAWLKSSRFSNVN